MAAAPLESTSHRRRGAIDAATPARLRSYCSRFCSTRASSSAVTSHAGSAHLASSPEVQAAQQSTGRSPDSMQRIRFGCEGVSCSCWHIQCCGNLGMPFPASNSIKHLAHLLGLPCAFFFSASGVALLVRGLAVFGSCQGARMPSFGRMRHSHPAFYRSFTLTCSLGSLPSTQPISQTRVRASRSRALPCSAYGGWCLKRGE